MLYFRNFSNGANYARSNGYTIIKVRKNARVRLKKGHILRNLSVIAQRNDLQKWKEDSVRYVQRWIVETGLLFKKNSTNGLNVHVYPSTDKRPRDYIDLGKLKANNDDQN